MVTLNWSDFSNGDVVALDLYDSVANPDGVVFHFDIANLAAYDLSFVPNDDLNVVTIKDFNTLKTVTFNVDILTVTTDNVTFADGSVILVGDNSYGTANDGAGNTLVGGAGDDQLLGLFGNDSLLGGAGDDVLTDPFGNNTLVGGGGTDWFNIHSEVGSASTATGGAGRDSYFLDYESPSFLAGVDHNYLVKDFTPGAGGDIIYSSDLFFLTIGYLDQDPFAAGFLRLRQAGANTIFEGDRDGAAGGTYTWTKLLTLQNVQVTSLTIDNFPDLVVGTNANDLLTGTEKDVRNDGNDLLPGLFGNDTLEGLSGSDYLTGGAGNDVLNGGLGADAMLGGSGGDRYLVDNVADEVVEDSNAPAAPAVGVLPAAITGLIDTVKALIDYNLSGVDFVENLTLSGSATSGTGNELANKVTGNGRDNHLSGLAGNDTVNGGSGRDSLLGGNGNDVLAGGTGKDTLNGGAGRDNYDFNSALNAATNVDRITGYSLADDLVRLDNDMFTGLATGVLAGGRFHKAAGATAGIDGNDRIVYNSTSGNLYFDSDGVGGAASVLFATLAGVPNIGAADFLVVN